MKFIKIFLVLLEVFAQNLFFMSSEIVRKDESNNFESKHDQQFTSVE
jgi:hypothetical protein